MMSWVGVIGILGVMVSLLTGPELDDPALEHRHDFLAVGVRPFVIDKLTELADAEAPQPRSERGQ